MLFALPCLMMLCAMLYALLLLYAIFYTPSYYVRFHTTCPSILYALSYYMLFHTLCYAILHATPYFMLCHTSCYSMLYSDDRLSGDSRLNGNKYAP